MATFPIFSKRNNQKKADDVYIYDNIPLILRNQIMHILISAIGRCGDLSPYPRIHSDPSPSNGVWDGIQDILCREYGVFQLAQGLNSIQDCLNFFQSADTAKALDFIELSFIRIDSIIRHWGYDKVNKASITQDADSAIKELNNRFREHGIGYEFCEGQLIVLNSQLIHEEIVKPALTLLNESGFKGAEEEYLSAHKHFREKRFKEAVNEALKAFESTMKTISSQLRWDIPTNATARELIKACFDKKLLPEYLDSHMNAVRSTLECGLPTVRNKVSAHGQGSDTVELPPYLASYALHLAATNIVLLVESYSSIRERSR